MKKIMFSVYLSMLLAFFQSGQSGVAAANCRMPKFPHEFTLREKLISLTTSFALEGSDPLEPAEKLGEIHARLISLTDSFVFNDSTGERVASARKRIFAWGTHVDVYDCDGEKIGGFRENLVKSWITLRDHYDVLDRNGEKVASSGDVDIFDTNFILTDLDGNRFASMQRPMVNLFTDHWAVHLSEHPAADPRVVVMIAAYKTLADEERQKARIEHEKELEREKGLKGEKPHRQ